MVSASGPTLLIPLTPEGLNQEKEDGLYFLHNIKGSDSSNSSGSGRGDSRSSRNRAALFTGCLL